MKTTLLSALFFGGLLLTTASASFAQTTPASQTTATAAPAHHEARAYVRQNVLPAVREQRRQLESQLTTADRAQLAIYRNQLREVRVQGRALRQSRGQGRALRAAHQMTIAELPPRRLIALRARPYLRGQSTAQYQPQPWPARLLQG